MPTFKIDIPLKAIDRLTELCVKERRPLAFQVEVQLLRSLGLWSNEQPAFDPLPETGAPDHALK